MTKQHGTWITSYKLTEVRASRSAEMRLRIVYSSAEDTLTLCAPSCWNYSEIEFEVSTISHFSFGISIRNVLWRLCCPKRYSKQWPTFTTLILKCVPWHCTSCLHLVAFYLSVLLSVLHVDVSFSGRSDFTLMCWHDNLIYNRDFKISMCWLMQRNYVSDGAVFGFVSSWG